MKERYYIYSTACSVHKRKTADKPVYDVLFRIVDITGKTRQKKLSGFPTIAKAKQAHAEFITQNCTLVDKIITPTPSVAVKDVLPLYYKSIASTLKQSSVYDIRNTLTLYFAPYIGDKALADLDKTFFINWQDTIWSLINPRTKKPYSHKYLSNIRIITSGFLSWCEDRYAVSNALKGVKKPKARTTKKNIQVWTKDQFAAFLQGVDNITYRTIFAVLFYTGRRRGEVLALHNTDVLEDRIHFTKTYSRKTVDGSPYLISTTKNEKRGTSIIPKPLKPILTEYTPQAPFYFGGEHPISENTLVHAFERYLKKSNLPLIHMHCLRHSFVSMCISLGASVYVVADLIGDSVEQVLKTYGHLYEEDKKKIIDLI